MIVLIIVLSVLLTAVLIGLIVPYYIVFYSPHRNADEIETEPFLDDMDMFNEIKAQARKLSEIPCSRVQTRASSVLHFSIIGQFLQDEGYNVLLVDQRAHFGSGGHTIAYGIRERRDVLSWIEYANGRFGKDKPIYLFGISMGAATVVMAADLALPDNVRLICADCPYSSPRDIIFYVAKRWYKCPSRGFCGRLSAFLRSYTAT